MPSPSSTRLVHIWDIAGEDQVVFGGTVWVKSHER